MIACHIYLQHPYTHNLQSTGHMEALSLHEHHFIIQATDLVVDFGNQSLCYTVCHTGAHRLTESGCIEGAGFDTDCNSIVSYAVVYQFAFCEGDLLFGV